MNKESFSKLSPRVNQRSVYFKIRAASLTMLSMIFGGLGGEGLAYLSGDATNEP